MNYVLEGSVRRDGDHLRVTGQLIQCSDQTHLWSGSFDGDLSDVLKLESDVARGIAVKIRLALPKQVEEHLAYAVRVNPKAYLAYLEGRQALNRRTKEGFETAIADFDRAIAIDPNYALAYAGLAHAYNLAPIFGVSTPTESYPQAAAAAVHALSLDDTLAEAHAALGFAKTHWEFDWPGAEREFRKGIDLDPNSADAHFFYSNCYLSPLGRHDEAIVEMKKALALDPLSLPVQSFLGRTYLFARRYDEARKQLSVAASMDPTFAITHERLTHLYEYLGKYEEAISEEMTAGRLTSENPQTVITREHALREAFESGGSRGYWKKLLELPSQNQPEAYVTSYGVAVIYAELGETEKAVGSLNKAYAERDGQMQNVGVEPAFDRLRSEPDFQSLLRRMGLVK